MLHLIVTLFAVIQVQAFTPLSQGEAPLRVLFFGGEWSSGNWLSSEDAVASRLKVHLEKYLNRKVVMRAHPAPKDLRELDGQVLAKLSEEPADYVFYFCDSSHTPVSFAAEDLAFWNVQGDSFWDQLGRQIGMIRLALQMRKSPRPEDVVLRAFDGVMSRLNRSSSSFGAKFVLLWPGFPISALSWNLPVRGRWPVSMVPYLDILRPQAFVSADRLMLNLRKSGVPAAVNFQISAYFTAIRANADSNSLQRMVSADTQDDVAKMLATALVAQVF